jgi:hypothetical protein
MELKYVNQNEGRIRNQANIVYDLVVNNRNTAMVKSCCNFVALEQASDNYIAQRENIQDLPLPKF